VQPQQQYPRASQSSNFSQRKQSRVGGESPARSYRPPAPQTPLADEYNVRGSDSHGVALKAAKDKWNELGPLKLEEIVANSGEPIDQTLTFGQSHYNKYIIG
jgi:hypothetical protein